MEKLDDEMRQMLINEINKLPLGTEYALETKHHVKEVESDSIYKKYEPDGRELMIVFRWPAK